MDSIEGSQIQMKRSNVRSKTTIVTRDKMQNHKRILNDFTEKSLFESDEYDFFNQTVVYSKDLEFSNLVTILQKENDLRTNKEISVLIKFFENSKLGQIFENATVKNKRNIQNLLFRISKYSNYSHCENNNYLFREGQTANKFYFLIKGQVKVIKINQSERKISPEKYLDILENIKDDEFLLQKTLKANQESFNIPKDMISSLKEIKETLKLKISTGLSNIYNKDKGKIPENQMNDKIELKKNIKIKQTNPEIEKLEFIKRPFEEKIVTRFEYEELEILGKGSYFGDIALECKSHVRSTSVFCTEDCHFAEIAMFDYKDHILNFKQNAELIVSEMLLNSYFENFTDSKNFLTNYFERIVFKEGKINDIISNEGEIKNILLIKEGEVELFFHKNFSQIKEILGKLDDLLEIFQPQKKSEELFFADPKNQKLLKNPTYMTILKSSGVLCLGVAEHFYKFPQFYQIRVVSDTVKYYSISIQNFQSLLSNEPELIKIFKKKGFLQGKSLYFLIRDILISYLSDYEKSISEKLIVIEREKREAAKRIIESKITTAEIHNQMKFPEIKLKSKKILSKSESPEIFERKRQKMQTEINSNLLLTSNILNFNHEDRKIKKIPLNLSNLNGDENDTDFLKNPKSHRAIKLTKIHLNESPNLNERRQSLEKFDIEIKAYPAFKNKIEIPLKKGILKQKLDLNSSSKNEKEIQFLI